jgi:hypothetical protein
LSLGFPVPTSHKDETWRLVFEVPARMRKALLYRQPALRNMICNRDEYGRDRFLVRCSS